MKKNSVMDEARLSKFQPQSATHTPKVIVFRILIGCEGIKTEPNYFHAFSKKRNGIFVIDMDVDGAGANTKQVVEKAIELRDKATIPYDRVWAVFDKDSFPDVKFNGAIQKAISNGIDVAWSNEAFELWYLYHFYNRVTAMSRSEYKKAISKAVNNSPLHKGIPYVYAKNAIDNYEIMRKYGSEDNAIRWAEEKSKEYSDNRFATHNPCTMVFKLVRQLNGKDDELIQWLKEKVDA